MYRKIYSHANSIRVMMIMMMTQHGNQSGTTKSDARIDSTAREEMAAQARQVRPPLLSHTIMTRETTPYIVNNLCHYVQYHTMFCLVFVWCPCMAINVSVYSITVDFSPTLYC